MKNLENVTEFWKINDSLIKMTFKFKEYQNFNAL